MPRNWNSIQPRSLIEALRLAKDYAREKHNLSVERLADLMGVTHDCLYKWLSTGRLPANLIPSYELACRCHFVSRWLVSSSGKLVIDMPRGNRTSAKDIQNLQAVLNEAVGQILRFADERSDAQSALAAIQIGLESMAWHKLNIQKHSQPELALGDEE